MREKRLSGPLLQHAVLLGISLIAATLLYMFLSSQVEQSHERERARAGLLWNGYIKMFYEQAGDWAGLDAQLRQDRYMRGSDADITIHVYDRDGMTTVATTGAQNTEALGRKIPILIDGDTIGYTSVGMEKPTDLSFIIYGVPAILALLLYSTGMIHFRRERAAEQRTRYEVATAVLHRTAGESGASLLADVSPSQEPLEIALQELDKLTAKVERLETVRRTMVADIAHELRTPIAIMRTQLDNALYDGESLPLPKVAALHDETLRLTKLVRDLQELSLAESGNLPLEKSWFSLAELVQSVAEALSVEAEDRQLAVTVSSSYDIRIYADETRIRQILINLIGNGLEHARSTLRIEATLTDGAAEVIVADDGWGIEEEEQSRVFDRFYRSNKGSKPKSRSTGLGLGLAIAYQFALVHKGGIVLSSRWGEGTSFTLKLPIMDG